MSIIYILHIQITQLEIFYSKINMNILKHNNVKLLLILNIICELNIKSIYNYNYFRNKCE